MQTYHVDNGIPSSSIYDGRKRQQEWSNGARVSNTTGTTICLADKCVTVVTLMDERLHSLGKLCRCRAAVGQYVRDEKVDEVLVKVV